MQTSVHFRIDAEQTRAAQLFLARRGADYVGFTWDPNPPNAEAVWALCHAKFSAETDFEQLQNEAKVTGIVLSLVSKQESKKQ
jgi:phage-related protein